MKNKKERIIAKLKGDTCIECFYGKAYNMSRMFLKYDSIFCEKHNHGKHKKDWCRFFKKENIDE